MSLTKLTTDEKLYSSHYVKSDKLNQTDYIDRSKIQSKKGSRHPYVS